MYEYRATVVRVVDGDTVDLDVDLGFGIVKRDRFRLSGIDAWETKGVERDKGIVAKLALTELIKDMEVVIQTHKDRQEKYGRYLADLWYQSTNVHQWLVEHGHAIKAEYSP